MNMRPKEEMDFASSIGFQRARSFHFQRNLFNSNVNLPRRAQSVRERIKTQLQQKFFNKKSFSSPKKRKRTFQKKISQKTRSKIKRYCPRKKPNNLDLLLHRQNQRSNDS
ncbi:unnamed protein product [Oikopleura dioica]|uniref:Uncharacterized protein n=1 Tax=Oikopleura dioica TaxID=34765 RepID=E4XQR2_OIKDI|nr:unnamed protein product [Oikopleura dioica]